MLLQTLTHRAHFPFTRLPKMSSRLSTTPLNGNVRSRSSLADLPKSNVFTTKLPPDPDFPSPAVSHQAPRDELGPRMVKNALYTFVRPERAENAELLAVSHAALRNIGLNDGEETTAEFQDLVAGNKIFWNDTDEEGIYPWAQCYGGEPV